ncbi:uncharacterized protein [Triticum aestivum]|uniref:uncharacterized protein n=1 Tax=Triticum aestivum TaxID=4565 RepID=UPI001D023201|nr:uncharacterized protein LOC123105074 [Triticum aestivum]XP_044382994.1 uncharacterized protein LOC123105074 [Triticum aestivum]
MPRLMDHPGNGLWNGKLTGHIAQLGCFGLQGGEAEADASRVGVRCVERGEQSRKEFSAKENRREERSGRTKTNKRADHAANLVLCGSLELDDESLPASGPPNNCCEPCYAPLADQPILLYLSPSRFIMLRKDLAQL